MCLVSLKEDIPQCCKSGFQGSARVTALPIEICFICFNYHWNENNCKSISVEHRQGAISYIIESICMHGMDAV